MMKFFFESEQNKFPMCDLVKTLQIPKVLNRSNSQLSFKPMARPVTAISNFKTLTFVVNDLMWYSEKESVICTIYVTYIKY